MSMRNRIAVSLPPVFLRLALGVTFVWAGMGKLAGTMQVPPEDAAILGNMGVITPVRAGSSVDRTPPSPTTPLPPSGGGGGARADGGAAITPVSQPAPGSTTPPTVLPGGTPGVGGGSFTAADFPEGKKVESSHVLAVMIWKAGHPVAKEGGTAPAPIWPAALAGGKWPVYVADAVMITELTGGAMLLLGLLARLWALSIACVMAGAIWLTAIGPALQSGDTVLGILPRHDAWDGLAWMGLLYQFALMMMAVAVMFSGAGTLALDNLVFGRKTDDDTDDE